MEEEKNVSYLAFESSLAREERHSKRLISVIIALIIFYFLSVTGIVSGFLWYISLPVDEVNTVVDSENGNANYIGNDLNGDLYNGESDSEENQAGN